jgi:hypothetical protein
MNMAVKITNKDVIQSYLMTVSKYNFSVYEKRILYRLVEAMQCELEGKKLYPGLRIEKNLYDDRVVLMPISAFLANDDDENYTRVKKALLDLRNKAFEFDDGQVWKVIGIIEKPQFNYKRGWVRFEIQPEIYNAVLNFSKGFRKYELKTAMEFTSQYSMRFYELMSGQERPLIYTIEDLKIMFGEWGLTGSRRKVSTTLTPSRTATRQKLPDRWSVRSASERRNGTISKRSFKPGRSRRCQKSDRWRKHPTSSSPLPRSSRRKIWNSGRSPKRAEVLAWAVGNFSIFRHKGSYARRICQGTFHSPGKKSPVLASLVRYFLPFALDKYSVLRWQVFRKKEKNVALWWGVRFVILLPLY